MSNLQVLVDRFIYLRKLNNRVAILGQKAYQLFLLACMCYCSNMLCSQKPGFVDMEYELRPDTLNQVKRAVKIDPLQILFGEFPVYFEMRLSNHWSIEVGAGITRRNYVSGPEYNADNIARNVDINTGYTFRAAIRYYFENDLELNGFYVAPAVNVRKYFKTFGDLDEDGNLSGRFTPDSRQYVDGVLTAGLQRLGLYSNVFADFYFGIGYRWKFLDIAIKDENSPTEIFYSEPLNTSNVLIVGGVKLGFGF